MKKEGRRIYLDHAASTPLDPHVKEAMEPYWSQHYGNPGSLHLEGVTGKRAVEDATSLVAKSIGAQASEIIFTSGGTEGNSLTILGYATWLLQRGTLIEKMHFITSAVEHPSVLDVFRELEMRGAQLTIVGVDEEGILKTNELKDALTPETVLVSLMYANNEIGTIQPIVEVSKILEQYAKTHNVNKPIFHVDASQVPSYLDVNVKRLRADFVVFCGQKIYGPKGVGAFYMKKGVEILPLFFGGNQEHGLRPGTENVPLIVGFAQALKYAVDGREEEVARAEKLRDFFIEEVLRNINKAVLNGHREIRLANNANFSIPGINSEWLVLKLDAEGIAVGTRSACASSSNKGSYVITALGRDEAYSKSSFRFTLGKQTTKEDLEYVVGALIRAFEQDNALEARQVGRVAEGVAS